MQQLYKGYVPTKNKECQMTFKNKTSKDLMTFEEVKNLPEYAGILKENVILIDLDDKHESDILMQIVEEKQLDCKVYQTRRGRHFLFKNDPINGVNKCYTDTKLACGLSADIKVGSKNSYEVIKFDNKERFVEWDIEENETYQMIPKWLFPVKSSFDFLEMDDGEGRNSSLFSYELTLQSAGFEKNEAIEAIKIINRYIFKEPLSEDEINSITRDEAFAKPVFYNGKSFLHNSFAHFLKSEYHVKRINGQLHVYDNGIYTSGYRTIESKMIEVLPMLKSTQRNEVLKFLEIITEEQYQSLDFKYIAFENGIFNIETEEMIPFSPEYIITNRIPWDFNPNAYSKLCDDTLNKISCFDEDIRHLLEECIGYCFFRQNELSKSFILTGSGSNGKSTYLDMVKTVLGRQNYVSLDLNELSEKFSTSSMFGKLANIGDDIADDFLQGKEVAQFKKIVSGNDIKAENKGQDVFFFKPTVKMLFSANTIPRFRNKGFDAIKRRLVIIPFNAKFSKNDPDFDAGITWKLKSQEVAEYLIMLGIQGLKRVLENQGFTQSLKVQHEIEEFERDNNPILLFLDDNKREDIMNNPTKEVFLNYSSFCDENNFGKMAFQTFSKEITKRLNCTITTKRVNGNRVRIFEEF